MRRVIEAAAQQFHEHGYERTSMEAVAQASGVSKMTVYSYFPSKEALFEAVIGRRTDEVIGVAGVAALDPADPLTVLTAIGGEFLRLVRSDMLIGKHRALFAAASHQDAACRSYYKHGPSRLIDLLARYFKEVNKVGSLHIPKPELAADQFLALFLGSGHIRSMLGLGSPSARADSELLKANVRLFMQGYAAK